MGALTQIKDKPVIFFDGVCNFCNWWVNLVLRIDRKNKLYFASLQSESGEALKKEYPDLAQVDSVIFYDKGAVFTKSNAVLQALHYLPLIWQIARILTIIPVKLRDHLYDFVARKRYTWFGKRETCRIPSPEERERILG